MPTLHLALLGSPRVELDHQPVDLSRRKALALLAYLAVNGGAHSRDALAAFFWPDFDPPSAYAYLRTTLWTLNKAIGSDWLETEREAVSIRPGYWLDVARFRELAAVPATLLDAANLYRGDFMAGFSLPDSPAFDEWQLLQRESLRRELGTALHALVQQLAEAGQPEAAIQQARRWLALDSLNENAHRELMQLYYQAGQRAAALRQYQECVDILKRELKAAPEAETVELYRAIQEGRSLPPPLADKGLKPLVPDKSVQTIPVVLADAVLHYTLPVQTTPFVGRERELEEISRLLNDPHCRLLTLVGPGGIGKTRLALQAAAQAAGCCDLGACFVPLAGVSKDEYLIPALADALRLTMRREGDPREQLLTFLSNKSLLLVLDNFEHLLDGATLVADILTAAPDVTVLATSRERLGLQEEWLYEIQGLDYPRDAAVSDLAGYDAVDLFIQSARRAKPNFRLYDADKPAIARICQLVDGMPLAVELAAAWLQLLTPGEIVAEIERSLDFLSAQVRNLPPRHRSLRTVFESSWQRLSPLEQRVLSRLAIFRGGFLREAAEAITDDASLPLLLTLVSKSLLRRNPFGRFEMHELLRQFAEDKLDPAERERAYDRHSVYYASFMRDKAVELKGAGQLEALNTIEAEIDNIRIAWQRAFENRIVEKISSLITGLIIFYTMRSRVHESWEMLTWGIEHLQPVASSDSERLLLAMLHTAQATTLMYLRQEQIAQERFLQAEMVLRDTNHPDAALSFIQISRMYSWLHSNFGEAERWARRALAVFEAQGDRWGISLAIRVLGDIAHDLVRYDESAPLFQRSLDLSREIGDTWGISGALKMLGEVAYTLGDYLKAERLYREGVELSQLVGDIGEIAWGTDRLADNIAHQGRYDEADAMIQQSFRLAQFIGNRNIAAWCTFHRGEIAYARYQYHEARTFLLEAIGQFEALQNRQGVGWVLHTLSIVTLRLNDPHGALRLAQESLAIHEATNHPWGQAAAYNDMGAAALVLGDMESAQFYLRQSVAIAGSVKSVMLTLNHLVEVAVLWTHIGQPERAAETLAFVLHHPGTWARTKDRARRLLDSLPLPPDVLAAACQRGQARRLEAVVADVVEGLL
ncbi:MAG: tetratricopeptide repeat protein [Chloroflexi bacterium]|nr:tetratricopeptide repeat protein [Chloroflexota bacterium]